MKMMRKTNLTVKTRSVKRRWTASIVSCVLSLCIGGDVCFSVSASREDPFYYYLTEEQEALVASVVEAHGGKDYVLEHNPDFAFAIVGEHAMAFLWNEENSDCCELEVVGSGELKTISNNGMILRDLFDDWGNNYLYSRYIDKITISEGITKIDREVFFDLNCDYGSYNFKNYPKPVTVSMPSTLTEIGISAFARVWIEDIQIPENVKYIDADAFYFPNFNRIDAVPVLRTVSLPAGLETIVYDAFQAPNSMNVEISGYTGTTAQSYAQEYGYTFVPLDGQELIGDVTLDGKVSLADVVRLNKHSIGTVQLNDMQMKNADCNGDGVVDDRDEMMLVQYLLRIIDTL